MPCCRDQPRAAKGKSTHDLPHSALLANHKTPSSTNLISAASPYYANSKFDLYYPKKRTDVKDVPEEAKKAKNSPCPVTWAALEYIKNMDLTPVLDKVDINKNDVLRTIKRLDEKLNSPVCRFLEPYQPDIPCSCEETVQPDAQCPCPPVKEPLNFDLAERKYRGRTIGTRGPNDSCICDRANHSLGKASSFQTSERDLLEKQVKALDEKLCSPELYFLKPLEPEQIARCACERTNFPQAHCACPPTREPIDFRNKNDVQNKIKAIDGILKSPDIGFTCGVKAETTSPCTCGNSKRNSAQCTCSSKNKSILKCSPGARRPGSCLPNCPPPRCRCGKDCPAKPGPFQRFPDRTFHVPECPSDRGWMVQPRSPVQGTMACPFSPACCPIAEVCPFPVATVFDPNAPPLPPVDGTRKCPLVPTTLPSSTVGDPSRPPCPLDPLKPPRGPPSCPLTSPAGCPMGQKSDCPLLTCSLGPLKSIIFDGNEECPFCNAKCCPMISPDGPGCPMSINATFCPLGNTDACCLKGMSSPPLLPGSAAATPAPGLKSDEESCPIGELLEANAKTPGCRCRGQQNACPLTPPKPCPAVTPFPQSSCYCTSSAAPDPSTERTMRPDSCPLGNISIPQPPAPPCPLTLTSAQAKQCPAMNLGDKNLDASCPVSNMFQCPALRKKPFSLLNTAPSEQVLETKTPESEPKRKNNKQNNGEEPKGNAIMKQPNVSEKKSKPQPSMQTPQPQKHSKRSSKQKTSKQAIERANSETVRKADKEMTKTFSRISDSTSNDTRSGGTSSNEVFEVSLDSLPRPPLSDTRLVKAARVSTTTTRRSSPGRENALPLVKTAAPSDSKGFEPQKAKPKPRNCPIPDPEPCPLEVPRCPFGPPEPSCPLAKVPNCPLRGSQGCCMTGMMFSSQKQECPVETTPCTLFPEGHCPMENLKMCECNYPVAPCMEPLIPEEDAQAEEQYCSRLDCCMGLPLPPTKPSEECETDTWYAYTDVKPGHPATKHYLEILDVPPEPEFFVSINAFRKHPAWKIIRNGEGYKECKMIKQILAARGPTATLGTQFVADELPDDEEIEIIERNRQHAAEAMERIKVEALEEGWN